MSTWKVTCPECRNAVTQFAAHLKQRHPHNKEEILSLIPKHKCACNECNQYVYEGKDFVIGHNSRKKKFIIKLLQKCQCGCENYASPGSTYIHGHNPTYKFLKGHIPWNKGETYTIKPWKIILMQLCKCGCSEYAKPGNRFIFGHNFLLSRSPWNKDLTKDLDVRVAAYAEKGAKARRTPEARKAAGERNQKHMLQYYSIPENRKLNSDRIKTFWDNASNEFINNFSNKMKEQWQDPNYVKKQMQARSVKQNKLENKFENILNSYFPNVWDFVGDGKLIVSGKCPDFWDGHRRIIEIFGCYFHSCPIHFQHNGAGPNDEKDRIALFEAQGYKTILIWEHDVRKNKDKVINLIKGFN